MSPSKHIILFNGGLLSDQSPPFSCPDLYHKELEFPGSLALWLLGVSANGKHWQKIGGWGKGKDWSTSAFSASCGTSNSICVLSTTPSPSIYALLLGSNAFQAKPLPIASISNSGKTAPCFCPCSSRGGSSCLLLQPVGTLQTCLPPLFFQYFINPQYEFPCLEFPHEHCRVALIFLAGHWLVPNDMTDLFILVCLLVNATGREGYLVFLFTDRQRMPSMMPGT